MGRKRKGNDIKLPGVKQLPSGAWNTKIQIDGKRVSITKDSREACIAEYLALKNGVVEAKKEKVSGKVTLEEAVEAYIDSKRGFLSPATIAGYEKFKRNFMQSSMKRNIYTTTSDQWQEAIKAERKAGKSPKYIKNGWMFFAACIKKAGAERPEVMLYPEEQNEKAYLEPDEIVSFVAEIKGKPVEIPALLCLSSLRRSEMLALTWDNVDLKREVLYVRGATVRGPDGLTTKSQNKTDKSRRSVPIIPPLMDALRAVEDKTGPVVTMGGDTVYKQVKRACAAAGVTSVDLHGLRHSFASLAYHLQIPEMIAAKIGGWNDLGTMHKIYTHLAEKDIKKRSLDFCGFFETGENKMRKVETDVETEKQIV